MYRPTIATITILLILIGVATERNAAAQDAGKPISQQKLESLLGMDSGPVTETGYDRLRIITGTPKKEGESAFSMTLQWRMDGNLKYEGTALAFVRGPDKAKPDTASMLAKRINKAIPEGIMELLPKWQGAVSTQAESDDGSSLPEVIVENKTGHSFTHLTLRDFTNQDPATYIMEPSFNSAGVAVAVDLVSAASVASMASLFGRSNEPKVEKATGGTVTVTLGEREPVVVETKNKFPKDIEKELAKKLNAKASGSPLVPDTEDRDVRNVKPFDGSEVHLPPLEGSTFSINIQDPSLGVITKFKFPDQNAKSGAAKYFIWVIAAIVLGFLGYLIWKERNKTIAEPERA